MAALTPFRIEVLAARIDRIRTAVAAFDWDAMPELAEGGDPWSAGASTQFLRRICAHWATKYDWRAQEAAINRFPQFVADIDGQSIHLIHERGSGPHDTALVLTHGWPGSIVEFLGVIERLAHPERFGGRADQGVDVVVPALPGFGFSGCPAEPIGPRAIAGIWDRLLRDALGYERYIAQGGDWGSMVSAMCGLDRARGAGGGCEAIHLNYFSARVESDVRTDEDRAFEQRCAPFMRDGRGYSEMQRTRPQTLGIAMTGNPVGQAAWILDKFQTWSDTRERGIEALYGLDWLVTNVMLYAATDSFTTSAWIYRAAQFEVMRTLPAGTRIAVPTGFASFPCEIRPQPPRALLERTYDVIRYTAFDRGGHFAASEQPQDFAAELSAFVAQVRAARQSSIT